jgi:hypothetical protein
MGEELSESARRVQRALSAVGIAAEVVELPQSTRTAISPDQLVQATGGQVVPVKTSAQRS